MFIFPGKDERVESGNQDNRESVVPRLLWNYLRWPFWTPLKLEKLPEHQASKDFFGKKVDSWFPFN